MKLSFKHKGDFGGTEKFFDRMLKGRFFNNLEKYGEAGVEALASATPVDSGLTANSWGYKIVRYHGKYKIIWTNSNVSDGVLIAVILQYGHGTRQGGYVQGRDYINPAIRPIFDKIAIQAWKEVTKP